MWCRSTKQRRATGGETAGLPGAWVCETYHIPKLPERPTMADVFRAVYEAKVTVTQGGGRS